MEALPWNSAVAPLVDRQAMATAHGRIWRNLLPASRPPRHIKS